MTILLAIETSTELASLALDVHGRILTRELAGTATHSSGVLPAVQSLLNEAGLRLNQCDAIAFGCGPGAFTGVRTACGVAQGLAFGAELPVISVVSLLAMAQAALEKQKLNNLVAILDARMNEVYWAHYVFENQTWPVKSAPMLSNAEQAFAYAAEHQASLAIGNGVIVPATFANLPQVSVMPNAQSVACLAQGDFAAGKMLTPELAEPFYLRNKIALTSAERLGEKS